MGGVLGIFHLPLQIYSLTSMLCAWEAELYEWNQWASVPSVKF